MSIELIGFISMVALIAVLSLKRTKIGKQLYLGACGFMAVMGSLVMGTSREGLLNAVSYLPEEQSAFMDWCISAFDRFAVLAMAVVFMSILVVAISIRMNRDKRLGFLKKPVRVVASMQIALFLINIVYGINLTNDLLNVGLFITTFTLGAIALMYVGYILCRMEKDEKQ